MDHSAHAHAHAAHEMAMPMRCKMNMLWNTDIIDTCIVFRSWHVTSTSFFLGSCIAIVLLGVLYEYLRVFQRRLDVHIALALQNQSKGKTVRGRERDDSRGGNGAGTPRLASASPEGTYLAHAHDLDHEESGLLSGRRLIVKSLAGVPVPPVTRALRAAVYGATVFLSFFLMLVFMTYNAYLIAAVVVGAALGHYVFGSTINVDAILAETASGKGMACH